MEDKFDKILSKKIKDLTENSETPYNPEHWDLLLAKKNKKRRGIFAYWKYAAVLVFALLTGGIGNYLYNNSDSNKSIKPQIIFDQINDSLRIDSLRIDPKVTVTSIDNDSLIKNNIKIKEEVVVSNERPSSINNNPTNQIQTEKVTEISTVSNTNVIAIATSEKEMILKDSLKNTKENSSDTFYKKEKVLVAQTNDTQKKDSIIDTSKIALNNEKTKKDSLFQKQDFMTVIEEKEIEQKSDTRGVKLGLDFSPVMDYSSESENSNVSYSGGVVVEVPISKKINVNTGVFYSNRTLALNQPVTYLADEVRAKGSKKTVDEENIIQGIGIPINIKYNFNMKDKSLFVSAGISSTTYIKNNIESTYLVNDRTESVTQDSYGNNIVKYNVTQSSETRVTPAETSTFNFADALNFSFGIELPVNNQHQSILIEPYFKYYLEPVSPQKVDYNSVGFHLRYNFSFKKNNNN